VRHSHDALWAQLDSEAMAAGELEVAERAALATGDMTRARYLALR